MDFERTMGPHPQDPEEQLAAYAMRYHLECEMYDQQVCSSHDDTGIARPASGEERALVAQNAKRVLHRLEMEWAQKSMVSGDRINGRLQAAVSDAAIAFERLWAASREKGVPPYSLYSFSKRDTFMTEQVFIDKWRGNEKGMWAESACALFWARVYGMEAYLAYELARDYMSVPLNNRAPCSAHKAQEILDDVNALAYQRAMQARTHHSLGNKS